MIDLADVIIIIIIILFKEFCAINDRKTVIFSPTSRFNPNVLNRNYMFRNTERMIQNRPK